MTAFPRIEVHVDEDLVAQLVSHGPRKCEIQVPPGVHRLKVVDFERPTPAVLMDEQLAFDSTGIIGVHVRTAYRRRGVGEWLPPTAWRVTGRPPNRWSAPKAPASG